jgi:dephospho-CoA kinase
VIAVEVPLLFETGFDRLVDRTVAVTARAGARAGRAAARGMGPRELDFFSKRQWPGRRKAARADYVIRNDGTPRELARRVRDLYARLARESLSARGRPRGGKP